ncbi:hypothetical protein F5146DRAFT_995248 [Armillaria mellea]|nr:hypothetical protein F5146DRAFT_995248 [Armillaria mellea]
MCWAYSWVFLHWPTEVNSFLVLSSEVMGGVRTGIRLIMPQGHQVAKYSLVSPKRQAYNDDVFMSFLNQSVNGNSGHLEQIPVVEKGLLCIGGALDNTSASTTSLQLEEGIKGIEGRK